MNDPTLSACRHRGVPLAADRWTCESPRLVIPGRGVTSGECQRCPCANHPMDGLAPGFGSVHSTTLNGQVWPDMSVDAFVEAIRKGASMPPTWPWWQVAQRAHRLLFDLAVNRVPAYRGTPGNRASGGTGGTGGTGGGTGSRGIVMAAGGPVYFACAFISVHVLRALGCTLPVEFWHLGPGEITDQMRKQVEPLGVVCRDAQNIQPQPRRLAGWELKPFAILHCSFDQVLFLDADNIPAVDPTYLFDDPQFRKLGAVFWPDLPRSFSTTTWIPQISWDVAGITWRDDRAFESGQLLIDKRQCWRELNLAMHLNEHSDFWYRYVYGDKDTFKLAWHKVNRPYAMPASDADWAWPAILQHDLQGRLLFTHACQGKKQLVAGERLSALPMCDAAVEAARILAQDQSMVASLAVV